MGWFHGGHETNWFGIALVGIVLGIPLAFMIWAKFTPTDDDFPMTGE